jgi:AmmeMemoRadiSam system protein A
MTELLVATEQRLLLDIAAEAIGEVLRSGRRVTPDLTVLPAALRQPGATFVTLRREEQLLGCVGALRPYQPLAVDVAVHAVAAAFEDPRLPAVTVADYSVMSIHVSMLGPLSEVAADSLADLVAQVVVGVDGLLVEATARGLPRRATLLPSVWQQLPDPAEFVRALWHKAGLRAGDWPRDVVVSRYRVVEIADEGPRTL